MAKLPVDMMAMMAAMESAGGGEQRVDLLQFETENDALVHARKLTELKPGDMVETKIVGEDARKGVFAGATEEGRRALLLFYDDDREICLGAYPWGSLRIPA